MDELKQRAGERFDALHEAAKTAADSSKTRVQDVYSQAAEAIHKVRAALLQAWQHELAGEARARAAAWARDAARRLREGAPLLSPLALYRDLRDLLRDRVWRRSALIFACGALVGGVAGAALAPRAGRPPSGPHARALLAAPDHSVSLVEDAPATGAGAGEVVVRVQAFCVGGADRRALRGRGRLLRALLGRAPHALGRGFAGVVLDVGPGVEDLEMGDEVWGCVAEWCGGAASELLTVHSSCVGRRPPGLAADMAASLPWAGTAALDALEQLGYLQGGAEGKRVAVCGAHRAEGCVLLQLLAALGAKATALGPPHAAGALRAYGAQEVVSVCGEDGAATWQALQAQLARAGPWDALLLCAGALPRDREASSLLKARAPRRARLSLEPRALVSDRLPAPLAALFAAGFHTYRILRWCSGCGWHAAWLQPRQRRRAALDELALRVREGQLGPVLDKVFLPQAFENALGHACSEDAVGASVIRFP